MAKKFLDLSGLNYLWGKISPLVVPKGGTVGQVLSKKSNEDNDVEWVNQSGGVSSYNNLTDKPQINSVSLSGNKTSQQLGLQDQLVSGTTIKTINGQPVLGSGNLNTANGYIHADDVASMPTPSANYASKICLVPSTTSQGSFDQYACIEDAVVNGQTISGWSWVLIGTTAPIVSVQRVDTLQQLPKWKEMVGYRPTAGASGNITTNTTGLSSHIYDIGDAADVYANVRIVPNTGSPSHLYMVFYYDATLPSCALGSESTSCLGWDHDKTENPSTTEPLVLTDDKLTLPSGTRYVLIVTSGSYTTDEYNSVKTFTPVPQSLVKKQVNANEILYFETLVSSPLYNGVSGTSEEQVTDTLSGWGIMFPQSYSSVGKQTPVIAMLHGLNGFVSSTVLGYPSSASWISWRDMYLSAGFAVLDVNGYGVSTSDDVKSRSYGNQQFVETLDKAFEYVKANYNVCDKLLLHGTSMGGGGALSYLMNHANKIAGVGLFAPALLPYSLRKAGDGASALTAWGYADAQEAFDDDYKRLVGYAPMMEGDFSWKTVNPSAQNPIIEFTSPTRLPHVPIRIWQGTNDEQVPYANTQKLVDLLRLGNVDVKLRTITNGTHNVSVGDPSYVRSEAVSWFKRFANL